MFGNARKMATYQVYVRGHEIFRSVYLGVSGVRRILWKGAILGLSKAFLAFVRRFFVLDRAPRHSPTVKVKPVHSGHGSLQ
jgi:hypothetical protein